MRSAKHMGIYGYAASFFVFPIMGIGLPFLQYSATFHQKIWVNMGVLSEKLACYCHFVNAIPIRQVVGVMGVFSI